jgi:hypothetical protein
MIEYKKVHGGHLPKSMMVIKFGSGTVEAAVASDIVKVGKQTTHMNHSLLLMIGKKLRFGGHFEGILGLGLPKSDLSTRRKGAGHLPPKITGFMETAGIPRFGVCFNPGAGGVLRLSQAAATEQLAAVGKSHWALGMGGISVGNGDADSSLCGKVKGQNKSCIGIPDSGTTLIMAPKDHIVSLFADLCSRWPRCQKHVSANSKEETSLLEVTKSSAFQELLLGCKNFTNDSHGLDQELPEIHFHLSGSNGRQRKLTLTGASYVHERMQDEIHYVRKMLFGVFPLKIPVPTGKKTRVCTPAFGAMVMKSVYTGPVWILGQPIFYEFQVGYDMETKPPAISFTKGPCGSCEEGVVKEDVSLVSNAVRHPTLALGPARLPSIDLSEPL